VEFGDAYLVGKTIEGDNDAFASLVKRYQGAVYATAFYYVGRYGAAEDIAQESLWAAYRSLPRLKDPERFAPWLKEIACRTSANWLRRHGKRRQKETPLPMRRTISIEDARMGPRGQVESKERFELIQNAIDSLPERYRLPVVLRYLQELSYDEISAFTGESKDEIRGILQRAARQLRDLLSSRDSSNKSDEGEGQWHPVHK
jgi:RNA polymerase sigma-70 factor (ECF subfamily)